MLLFKKVENQSSKFFLIKCNEKGMMLYNFSDFLNKEMEIKINDIEMHHYHIYVTGYQAITNFLYVLTLDKLNKIV